MKTIPWTFAALLAAALGAGCSSQPRRQYLERDVVRIVVLPPVARDVSPDSCRTFWPDLADGFRSRGYQVIRLDDVIRHFAAQGNGLGLGPEEIAALPAADVARVFKADAVAGARVTQCDSNFQVVASEFRIEADFELLDGRNGQVLWQTHSAGVNESRVKGRGLEAILGVVATAANAAAPDVPGCWKRCVSGAVRGLPWAGRDPENSVRVSLPSPSSIRESRPTYVADASGWTLGFSDGLLLLSNVPGPVEEVERGFSHHNMTVSNLDQVCIFAGRGKDWSLSQHRLPPGWEGDLLQEFRKGEKERPGLTIREWLKSRHAAHPSPEIAKLFE